MKKISKLKSDTQLKTSKFMLYEIIVDAIETVDTVFRLGGIYIGGEQVHSLQESLDKLQETTGVKGGDAFSDEMLRHLQAHNIIIPIIDELLDKDYECIKGVIYPKWDEDSEDEDA